MEYLAAYRLPKDLQLDLEAEPSVSPPQEGLHCTIWLTNWLEEDENTLRTALRETNHGPITTRILDLEGLTYKDYALMLDKTSGLREMHQQVIQEMRKRDVNLDRFEGGAYLFGGERYRPHITISHSEPVFNKEYIGRELLFDRYALLKKNKGIWTSVEEFKLQ